MITKDPIDPGAIPGDIDTSCGGVVTFLGIVRADERDKRVTGIYYECYDAMALRELDAIVAETRRDFGARSVDIVHRVGEVAVGDVSLMVRVFAAHRREAFAACEHAIAAIKSRVPIWKKERYDDDTARWL